MRSGGSFSPSSIFSLCLAFTPLGSPFTDYVCTCILSHSPVRKFDNSHYENIITQEIESFRESLYLVERNMNEQAVINCFSMMSFSVRASISRQITIVILGAHNVHAMGKKQSSSG